MLPILFSAALIYCRFFEGPQNPRVLKAILAAKLTRKLQTPSTNVRYCRLQMVSCQSPIYMTHWRASKRFFWQTSNLIKVDLKGRRFRLIPTFSLFLRQNMAYSKLQWQI